MNEWKKILKTKKFKDLASKSSTIKELAELLAAAFSMKVTESSLRHAYAAHKKEAKLPDKIQDLFVKQEAVSPKELLTAKEQRDRETVLREQQKLLLQELQQSQQQLDIALSIRDGITEVAPILPKIGKKHQATAVALASDWHVEELVDPRTVNGRNEYNLEVADKRIKAYFQAIDWLIKHHRNSIEIDTLVLWLGGDLMTGYIHEELEESNQLSPTETVLWLIERLTSGIDFLKQNIKLKVLCSYGNHGRTTKKRRISTGAKNSYEWMMYKILAQQYENDKSVEFTVADGDHVYLDVYRWTLRFTHGDNFSYGGGVGGLSIPIMRGVQRLQSFKHADITCVGHFHQQKDFGDVVVNGSLIGYSPYAVKINASYEPPQQAFFLIDPECPVGKCMSTPIWLEGEEK